MTSPVTGFIDSKEAAIIRVSQKFSWREAGTDGFADIRLEKA